MRFMMSMIPEFYKDAKPGALPDMASISTMIPYNESLQKAGVLLALDGLHPPATMNARVTFADGKAEVTDGPFAEAKEIVGGFWIIAVKSREEALEWASRCPAGENDVIEIRQMIDMSDFPADVRDAFPEFVAEAAAEEARIEGLSAAAHPTEP